MAQYVDYWANNITYTEGPFVICGGPIGASVGRIECEVKNHYTCMEPHHSIALLIRTKREAGLSKADIVDWLNAEVRAGNIVCTDDGVWVVKEGQ